MTSPPSVTCSVCHVALNPDMQRDGMCSTCYRLSQEAAPPSAPITVGDPWPDRDPLSPRIRFEAMYLARGQVTHLVQALADLNNFPYTPALCDMEPEWPDLWRGHGSQDEYDEAARRPLCTRCLARDPKRQEWLARCAEIAANAPTPESAS